MVHQNLHHILMLSLQKIVIYLFEENLVESVIVQNLIVLITLMVHYFLQVIQKDIQNF